MNELLNRLIASDFADLEGLQLSGTLPVKQELLNEAIAQLLSQGQESVPSPSPASRVPDSAAAGGENTSQGRAAGPKIDPKALLKFVRRAEVTAEGGKLTFHFDVRVGGAGVDGA